MQISQLILLVGGGLLLSFACIRALLGMRGCSRLLLDLEVLVRKTQEPPPAKTYREDTPTLNLDGLTPRLIRMVRSSILTSVLWFAGIALLALFVSRAMTVKIRIDHAEDVCPPCADKRSSAPAPLPARPDAAPDPAPPTHPSMACSMRVEDRRPLEDMPHAFWVAAIPVDAWRAIDIQRHGRRGTVNRKSPFPLEIPDAHRIAIAFESPEDITAAIIDCPGHSKQLVIDGGKVVGQPLTTYGPGVGRFPPLPNGQAIAFP